MPIGFDKDSIIKQSNNAQTNVDDEAEDDLQEAMDAGVNTARRRNIVIGIVAGVVALGIIGMVVGSGSGGDAAPQTSDTATTVTESSADADGASSMASSQSTETTQNQIYDADGNTVDPNGINPGITDYKHSTNLIAQINIF